MTSASHGFKTLRSPGIASNATAQNLRWVVARCWGAHAAPRAGDGVLTIADFSPTLLEPGSEWFRRGRRNLHASRVRSPETIPTNSRERLLIGPCDHSKINFFQLLRLLLPVKFFSHCIGARMPDSRKQTGIVCCIEQRSR